MTMRPTDALFGDAIRAHGTRVERFRRGEISGPEFTPIRLGYGLYYQLDHTSYMQRIKLPGGLLTAAQADCIAGIVDDLGRGVLHVTTRQDVQLHWVPLERVIEMYERLQAVGISTRGACADSVRNVTACYHAGGVPDELVDVTGYCYAVHEYSLFHPLNLTLPRKFKIAFASCAADCVQGRINDIVFYPCREGDRLGFRVYAGGGLGSQPYLAIKVRDFVPLEDTLVVTEAILRVQHRSGERKNRKKARMKFLMRNLGGERFVAEIGAELERVERECGAALRQELSESLKAFSVPPPLHRPAALPPASDSTQAHWQRTNVVAQRQDGYFGVTVQLPLGDLTTDQLRAITALAREHGSGMLRTSNDQNLYIPWVPGDRVPRIYARLVELRLAAPDALHITDVTSCPGADYCSLAVSRSMGMADAIRHGLLATNGEVEDIGVFRIKISGCPNSCGQHHIGDIGLTGLQVKGPGGQESTHYSILVGGSVGEDAAVGQRLSGRYPEDEVPSVIAAVASYYRSRRESGEPFRHFVDRVGSKALSEVARAAAPSAV
jgi:sulfite reductase beta subunit-like hemoprotein